MAANEKGSLARRCLSIVYICLSRFNRFLQGDYIVPCNTTAVGTWIYQITQTNITLIGTVQRHKIKRNIHALLSCSFFSSVQQSNRPFFSIFIFFSKSASIIYIYALIYKNTITYFVSFMFADCSIVRTMVAQIFRQVI